MISRSTGLSALISIQLKAFQPRISGENHPLSPLLSDDPEGLDRRSSAVKIARRALLRSEYLTLRYKFQPATVKLVVVVESPPKSGSYFYDPSGRITEPLFAAR